MVSILTEIAVVVFTDLGINPDRTPECDKFKDVNCPLSIHGMAFIPNKAFERCCQYWRSHLELREVYLVFFASGDTIFIYFLLNIRVYF